MRYYFHLESDTNVHVDHVGEEFDQPYEAIAHAYLMARDLAQEDKWLGWKVKVINTRNEETICVPIVEKIQPG